VPPPASLTYEKRADLLLCELLGVRVSKKATICWVVKRLGYTPKKDRWVLQKETSGSEERLGG
jgi:transposase